MHDSINRKNRPFLHVYLTGKNLLDRQMATLGKSVASTGKS